MPTRLLDGMFMQSSAGKDSLGKVFVSHSWADKRFVRRLEKRLNEQGYATWLDEKELLVGDSLPLEISEALSNSRVVLIVVSETSLKSRWLRFELDAATERMIEGSCRVMPILIHDVSVPPELSGRLYADMRRGKRGGFAKILATLDSEAAKLGPKRLDIGKSTAPSTESAKAYDRARAYEAILADLADEGPYSAAIMYTIRQIEYTGFVLGSTEVVLEMVHDYGHNADQQRFIHSGDVSRWREQIEAVHAEFGLLICEYPLARDYAKECRCVNGVVESRSTDGLIYRRDRVEPVGAGSIVIATVTPRSNESDVRNVLQEAVTQLRKSI